MESSRLKMEIAQRNELLYKIDAETLMVEKVNFLENNTYVIVKPCFSRSYTFHDCTELIINLCTRQIKELSMKSSIQVFIILDNEVFLYTI